MMMMMMMMMVVMIMYFTKTSADTVTISNALPRRDTSGEIMVVFYLFSLYMFFTLNTFCKKNTGRTRFQSVLERWRLLLVRGKLW